MKICFMINSLQIGGAERMIIELSKELQKENHVAIMTLSGANGGGSFQTDGIHVISLGGKFISPLNLWRAYKVLRKGNFDVIHTHLTYAQLYGALLSYCFKEKKWMTTEHSNFNNRREYVLFRSFDRWLYSRFQKVISISKSVQENLIQWLKVNETDKFIIIPNAISLQKFRSVTPVMREVLGISSTDIVLLMVGRLVEAKDPITILKALEKLPNHYHFVMVGEGPLKNVYENFICEKGIQRRAHFVGPKSNVHEWMKMADIYIQSSHWEGMPTAILEAMAVGVPVIGSKVPGNTDLLQKEAMFEHENVDDLLRLIRSDLSVIKRTQQQIVMSYDIVDIGKRISNLYKNGI